MPIPSFKDTLNVNLGPDITIVTDGDYFLDENVKGLDVGKMNAELAMSTKGDDIEFMPAEQPREDLSLKFFLSSQKDHA